MPTDISPRFRTAHEAGKYVAAQLYDYARGLNPEEFGAVPRYIENPAWHYAQFTVIQLPDGTQESGSRWEIRDRLNGVEEESKPACEWYREAGVTIIFADGWPEKGAAFIEEWNYNPITKKEFLTRLSKCTIG